MDINFGTNSIRDAHIILGEINDVLKSRGLALNLAKTEILTADEAAMHFMFLENVRLSKIEKKAQSLKSKKAKDQLARDLVIQFYRHLRASRAKNRNKVTKRYITIFRKLNF